MVDISYRVLPGVGGSFDVQITRPGGRPRTAVGFGSEHEAKAWIIQTQRMIREAGPWTPLVPRKSGGSPVMQAAPVMQATPPRFTPAKERRADELRDGGQQASVQEGTERLGPRAKPSLLKPFSPRPLPKA